MTPNDSEFIQGLIHNGIQDIKKEQHDYCTVSQTVQHENKTFIFEADFFIIYEDGEACADIQDIRFEEVKS